MKSMNRFFTFLHVHIGVTLQSGDSDGPIEGDMRHLSRTVVSVVAIIASAAMLAAAQAPAQKPSFEVASVKPNTSPDRRYSILRQPGGRLVITNRTLKMLIGLAYVLADFQISGGPSWITVDRWNIEGKPEDGNISQPTAQSGSNLPDPRMVMLQSLLEDRFQLKAHRETKQAPVYELVVSNGGSKLKRSEDQTLPPPPPAGTAQSPGIVPRGGMVGLMGAIEGNAVTLRDFSGALSLYLAQVVIDKTELSGLYDLRLKWTPQPALERLPTGDPLPLRAFDGNFGPSIFTALQEQLGLKLVASKGFVEVLVIDNVQKPSEN